MVRKRSMARELALKVLYQRDITGSTIEVACERFWANSEEPVEQEIKEFTNRLVLGVQENLAEVDKKISEYATNWQLKRMAIIDRNILRIGVFELKWAPDIPPVVTINEAVELAKKYGDMESSKFVNGILDKIHKTEIPQQKDHKNDPHRN